MTTYNPLKHKEKNYIILITSTPKHHSQRIGAMSVHSFNLHTTAKLPQVGKQYMCFQIDGKPTQATKCVKSKIMTKVIDCVIFIDTFEKHV